MELITDLEQQVIELGAIKQAAKDFVKFNEKFSPSYIKFIDQITPLVKDNIKQNKKYTQMKSGILESMSLYDNLKSLIQ